MESKRWRSVCAPWLVAGLLGFVLNLGWAGTYDPLRVDTSNQVSVIDTNIHDAAREREIPVRIYLPESRGPNPVLLFSHGLGGSRLGSAFLGHHWAGYVAVFLQHPGSDDTVWKSAGPGEGMQALRRAASLTNFILRVQDVHTTLDQLERWNAYLTNPISGRLDFAKIGMCGHSFGAVTTEAVSGERLPVTGTRLTDLRIKAAVIFSPSTPELASPDQAFGSVHIPWLLMTGTKDLAPIGHADMKSRLGVYPALHGAPKYELVLDNAEHSVFTDRALPGDRQPRNPNHHRVILAISTAFWDAYLRGIPEAQAWLEGSGPRSVMEPQDKWQHSR